LANKTPKIIYITQRSEGSLNIFDLNIRNMKFKLLFFSIFLFSIASYSQDLVWTGAVDSNFFNELNWKFSNSNNAPEAGTINNNVAINVEVSISDANQLITANGIINLGSGSLILSKSGLKANGISAGTVIINEEGYLDLENTNPFLENVHLEINSGIGWVRTKKLDGATIVANHINHIKVNQQTAVYKTNLRLDNYYFGGTVIRSNSSSINALTIYEASNLAGNSANLSVDVVHNGHTISNNMNDKTVSFLLRRGFMVTFATAADGTNKSKNYIALEEDLIVHQLPDYLLNDISFIRVVPWNWVTKKGIGGNFTGLDEGWFYKWNNNGESTLNTEYGPMAWGSNAADDDDDIELYKSIYKATHVLAFNESDHCEGQSGQYNNLCQTDVAVGLYKNLMKTGLRLVSPSGRENAPFGWLKEFHEKATAQDIRIDVIGVHWYDWASNPENSPNANPTTVFNRFKDYLQRVYAIYKLPIWITEFNANPNRTTSVNLEFMKLALPYLESLDYVERYAWFQPSSDVADYYEATNTLTNVGVFYKNQVSTPAIPENILTADTNLDMYYRENAFQIHNLLVNGDFETGDLTGWNGSETIDILSNENTYEGTTSGRIKAGAGNIYQEVTLESSVKYDLSFYTKWFVAPSSPIELQILNAVTDEKITSKIMTMATAWNLVELSFTVPADVTSVKILIKKEAGSPGWFVDYALLKKSANTLSNQDLKFDSGLKIYPNPSRGFLFLESLEPIEAYYLYDLRGKLLQSERIIHQLKKEITILKTGIYFLKIKNNSGAISVKKIVIH
jgi:hypothetical protein